MRKIVCIIRFLFVVSLFSIFAFAEDEDKITTVEMEKYKISFKEKGCNSGRMRIYYQEKGIIGNLGWEQFIFGPGTKSIPEPKLVSLSIKKEGENKTLTWDFSYSEEGIKCEGKATLYPERLFWELTYTFDKDWEGYVVHYPVLRHEKILGASYEGTDTLGQNFSGRFPEALQAPHEKRFYIRGLRRIKINSRLGPLTFNLFTYPYSYIKKDMAAYIAVCPAYILFAYVDKREDGIFPAGYSNKHQFEIIFKEKEKNIAKNMY